MTAPVINGRALLPASAGFASSVDITVTLGTNAGRWLLVKAIAFDPFALGFGAGYISSAVLDPGGANIALTVDADHNLNGGSPSYSLGANGRIAWFRIDSVANASMPTGTVTLRVTFSDANGKPVVYAVWGDGLGSALPTGTHSTGTNTSWASAALTATTNDLALGIGFFDCGGTPSGNATITGNSSTSASATSGQTAYQRAFDASKSAVNPTLTATIGNNSFTPAWFGRAWVLAGVSAPPVLSAPTASGGSLTGSGTVDSIQTGTLWWKVDTSATATDPGAGNEAGAGWTSQAMSVTGTQSVSFGALTAGSGKYAHYLGVNGGGRSSVQNAGPFTVSAGGGAGKPSFFYLGSKQG